MKTKKLTKSQQRRIDIQTAKKVVKKTLTKHKKTDEKKVTKHQKLISELAQRMLATTEMSEAVINSGIGGGMAITSLIMTAYREGINFARDNKLHEMTQDKTDIMILMEVTQEIKRIKG